jgi:hypothetical protein
MVGHGDTCRDPWLHGTSANQCTACPHADKPISYQHVVIQTNVNLHASSTEEGFLSGSGWIQDNAFDTLLDYS